MKKNEREKERENEDDDNAAARNVPRMNGIKRDVKFEEGGPERKKRNK